ncbi:hypothetical protein D3C75_785520 [compost metagenome]
MRPHVAVPGTVKIIGHEIRPIQIGIRFTQLHPAENPRRCSRSDSQVIFLIVLCTRQIQLFTQLFHQKHIVVIIDRTQRLGHGGVSRVAGKCGTGRIFPVNIYPVELIRAQKIHHAVGKGLPAGFRIRHIVKTA